MQNTDLSHFFTIFKSVELISHLPIEKTSAHLPFVSGGFSNFKKSFFRLCSCRITMYIALNAEAAVGSLLAKGCISDWMHSAPARHEHEAKRNANGRHDKLEFVGKIENRIYV